MRPFYVIPLIAVMIYFTPAVAQISPVSVQKTVLLIDDFSLSFSRGWWQVYTDEEVRWHEDGEEGFSLNPEGAFIPEMAILTSPVYRLARDQQVSYQLSIRLACAFESTETVFRIELWNGRGWEADLWETDTAFDGEITFNLDGLSGGQFGLKLVYESESAGRDKVRLQHIRVARLSREAADTPGLSGRFSTSGESLKVHMPMAQSGPVHFVLRDLNGHELRRGERWMHPGENRIDLPGFIPKRTIYLLQMQWEREAGLLRLVP